MTNNSTIIRLDTRTRNSIAIRLMAESDFDAVLRLDEKLVMSSRLEYYQLKFKRLFTANDCTPSSFVAEQDGAIIGFLIGEVYKGKFGIFTNVARIDNIGVDPIYQHKGVGKKLLARFTGHLRQVGINKVNTLVDWNNSRLIKYLSANSFGLSETINLERSM